MGCVHCSKENLPDHYYCDHPDCKKYCLNVMFYNCVKRKLWVEEKKERGIK